MIQGTVEETLNALLDAGADRLCNAQRYERSEARRDTRAGHFERGLQTKAGEVRLQPFHAHGHRFFRSFRKTAAMARCSLPVAPVSRGPWARLRPELLQVSAR
jgi:Transposase, Mutator family